MKPIFNLIAMLTFTALSCASCSKEEAPFFEGTDNSLSSLSVTVGGVEYPASISDSQIILSVPAGVDLSGGQVAYTLCEHASIVPSPSTIKDWNSQQVFRIKSYTQTPRQYTYTVRRTAVSETGNVQLLTQTELDAFLKLGITAVEGNLVIGSDSKPVKDSIVNLDGLRSIKEVRYNIIINRSFAGGTLDGLENIERCGGLHIGTISAPVIFPALSGISINMPKLKSAGDIILNSSSLKSLSLGALEVATSFFVSSNSIVALNAPKLKETARGLNIDNASTSVNSILSGISFPALERVGEALSIQYYSALTAISLPKLSYVGGNINMATNSNTLEELSLPELATVNGSVTIERAPGLLKFAMPKVKKVTSFLYNKSSYGNYPLMNLDLAALETITDEFYIRGIAMESFSLPKLVETGGAFTIWDLKLATAISIPSIKKLGGKLTLYSTSLLELLDISTLDTLAHLEVIGCLALKTVKTPATIGNITINYASAVCPTPSFEGLSGIDGMLELSSDSKVKVYDIRNIKSIGKFKCGGGAKSAVLNLYDTENIGTIELSSSNIVELNAPVLKEVETMNLSYVYPLAELN